jgi:FAD/FMN-containing dehydrogenase
MHDAVGDVFGVCSSWILLYDAMSKQIRTVCSHGDAKALAAQAAIANARLFEASEDDCRRLAHFQERRRAGQSRPSSILEIPADPLLDVHGHVVGINTAILLGEDRGGNVGIGMSATRKARHADSDGVTGHQSPRLTWEGIRQQPGRFLLASEKRT